MVGVIGGSMLIYSASRPGENGELSKAHQWIDQLRTKDQAKWEERNTLRTEIFEQAAYDKNLFKTVPKRDFEYRTPEYVEAKGFSGNRATTPPRSGVGVCMVCM